MGTMKYITMVIGLLITVFVCTITAIVFITGHYIVGLFMIPFCYIAWQITNISERRRKKAGKKLKEEFDFSTPTIGKRKIIIHAGVSNKSYVVKTKDSFKTGLHMVIEEQ